MDRSDRSLRSESPRMPDNIYPYRQDSNGETMECQICGEPADGEMGEFGLPDGQTDPDGAVSVVAHAQCGLDAGLEIA